MKTYKTPERQRVAVAEHYQKNREAKLAYAREYRQNHSAELKAYRDKHRVKMLAVHKAYYYSNREESAERNRRFHEANPGYSQAYSAEYNRRNRPKIRERKREYDRKRRGSDPLYRLEANLRARIYQALKSTKRHSNRTMKWTGCTIEFLKGWLESRWQPGMSWENYNRHGWHVDHVIPCDVFDLSKLEEARQCFHYSNLQPLWAKDNLTKSNFVGDGTKPKKTARSADRTATRESNLDSAAINPK